MSSAAFFGHRHGNYYEYSDKISGIIEDLIVNHDVTTFYNGARGDFDNTCAGILHNLKEKYPNVVQLMALSYYPNSDFYLPPSYDESVYLLEEPCPKKFAITYTNREIVKRCDYIISGVRRDFGGAWETCEYARRRHKCIISIFE